MFFILQQEAMLGETSNIANSIFSNSGENVSIEICHIQKVQVYTY